MKIGIFFITIVTHTLQAGIVCSSQAVVAPEPSTQPKPVILHAYKPEEEEKQQSIMHKLVRVPQQKVGLKNQLQQRKKLQLMCAFKQDQARIHAQARIGVLKQAGII